MLATADTWYHFSLWGTKCWYIFLTRHVCCHTSEAFSAWYIATATPLWSTHLRIKLRTWLRLEVTDSPLQEVSFAHFTAREILCVEKLLKQSPLWSTHFHQGHVFFLRKWHATHPRRETIWLLFVLHTGVTQCFVAFWTIRSVICASSHAVLQNKITYQYHAARELIAINQFFPHCSLCYFEE